MGDLRVAHFLATPALHGLPLVGSLASPVLASRPARGAVWLGEACTALVTATLAQALTSLSLV